MAQDNFFQLMEQHQARLGEMLAGSSAASREDIERAMLALGSEAQSHRDSLGLAIMRQGQTFFEMLAHMTPGNTRRSRCHRRPHQARHYTRRFARTSCV